MNNDTSLLRRPASNRRRRNQPRAPSPSVAEPRRLLLLAVLAFVLAARASPGVQRISLLGSILTAKAIPKDVDVLVTVDAAMELDIAQQIVDEIIDRLKPEGEAGVDGRQQSPDRTSLGRQRSG